MTTFRVRIAGHRLWCLFPVPDSKVTSMKNFGFLNFTKQNFGIRIFFMGFTYSAMAASVTAAGSVRLHRCSLFRWFGGRVASPLVYLFIEGANRYASYDVFCLFNIPSLYYEHIGWAYCIFYFTVVWEWKESAIKYINIVAVFQFLYSCLSTHWDLTQARKILGFKFFISNFGRVSIKSVFKV